MINPLRLDIPAEIKTERMILRIPRLGDGAMIIDTTRASLPELKPWLPWATDDYSVHDSEDWCRRTASKFLLREEAGYILLHRENGRHVGRISCYARDWRVPKFEIGYWLVTAEVGRGYMTEALMSVTEMAFTDMGARRIQIRADAENARSRRVAERAGYELEGILKNHGADGNGRLFNDCIYAMTR